MKLAHIKQFKRKDAKAQRFYSSILIYILTSIFAFSGLVADEPRPLIIDSDFVDYNGKSINLIGHSTVDHELGKVEAQKITLIPETESRKLRFAYLKMSEGVKIGLHDGGQLSCLEAEIDYHALTGKFTSGPEQEYVTYSECLKTRDPKITIPLEVKSRLMSFQLQRGIQNPSEIHIKQMTADYDVSANYNSEFLASADHGLYEKTEPPGDGGLLTLHANASSGICQVSNRNGDSINADKIRVDTLKRELQFDSPKGSMFTREHDDNSHEITFSCQTMTWNEPQDLLILQEQVEVEYRGVGTLTNPHEIYVQRKSINGHKQVSHMGCKGTTVLNYQDEKKKESHVLKSYNSFLLDHERLQAHLDSPRDANNHVLDDLQVHFSDSMGDIFADDVVILYQEINKKMFPTKLLLKGNVWLLSRTSIDKDDPGKIMQMAMADRVEYDIASKEMLCFADTKKRVLFFDKSNNLQISAPSVKAKRDPNTQKDSIQGMGDVRFSFIENEFDQMKKRFGDSELN